MVKGPNHNPVPVWGYPEEWEEVKKACWHATECGWTTYIAQMAQDNQEHRICQLAEFAKDALNPSIGMDIASKNTTSTSFSHQQ